jgi:predicted phosphoribosyltransferase
MSIHYPLAGERPRASARFDADTIVMRLRSDQPAAGLFFRTIPSSSGPIRNMQHAEGRCLMKPRFQDRHDAGRKLATLLTRYANDRRAIVLALPRGGVPVAVEIAAALNAELDILTVRKIGVPGQEELAMGAVASGGVRVLDDGLIHELHVSEQAIEAITSREVRELSRRERLYRGDRPFPDLNGRVVIIVDDGLATGSTMRAAILAVRRQQPVWIAAASPVGSRIVCEALGNIADESICYITPSGFQAVSEYYEDFGQTTDAELLNLLQHFPPHSSPSANRQP